LYSLAFESLNHGHEVRLQAKVVEQP
jgi:hypothetical protein